VQPAWLVDAMAIALVLVGAGALGLGLWGYRKALEELAAPRVKRMPFWMMASFTGALLAVAAAAPVLILSN